MHNYVGASLRFTFCCFAVVHAVYSCRLTRFWDPPVLPVRRVSLASQHSAWPAKCSPIDRQKKSPNLRTQTHGKLGPPGLTLCCSMASRALNSKGRELVCDDVASCGAKSKTNHRSRLSPRKSNTSKEFRVMMAFKDYWGTQQKQREDSGASAGCNKMQTVASTLKLTFKQLHFDFLYSTTMESCTTQEATIAKWKNYLTANQFCVVRIRI